MRRVVPQLIQFGVVQRASLGFQPAADPIARSFKVGMRAASWSVLMGPPARASSQRLTLLLHFRSRRGGRRVGWRWSACVFRRATGASQVFMLVPTRYPLPTSILFSPPHSQVSEGVLIQTADPHGAAAKAGLLPTRRGLGGIVPGEASLVYST